MKNWQTDDTDTSVRIGIGMISESKSSSG